MAITHVYIAPVHDSRPRKCGPLPRDRKIVWTRSGGRATVPPAQIPLTQIDRQGKLIEIPQALQPEVVAGDHATIDVVHSQFSPANVSIALGGTITWVFRDKVAHVALLANGPRALNTGIRRRGGRFYRQLTVPGTYNLFCWLHPVTMHQTVTVRSAPEAPTSG